MASDKRCSLDLILCIPFSAAQYLIEIDWGVACLVGDGLDAALGANHALRGVTGAV